MADVWHHAVSSARKFGGRADDYVPIHAWFDETKRLLADFRHRALRHHAEGIAQAVERFGPVVRNSSGRAIPVRWIGEQHVREDFGGRISHGGRLADVSPATAVDGGRRRETERDDEEGHDDGGDRWVIAAT